MIGSTLLAVTIVPVLCTWLVRGPFHSEERNVVMRALLRIYEPALDLPCAGGRLCSSLAALLLFRDGRRFRSAAAREHQLLAIAATTRSASRPGLGSEFMPPLNEGSLLFMPTCAGNFAERSQTHMAWQDRVIKETPEVLSVAAASSAAPKPPPTRRRRR